MKLLRRIIPVLLVLSLCLAQTALATGALNLTAEERHAMNLFLSNFTEVGSDVAYYGPDEALVDFAHDHMWFNSYDSYEYGDYFNGNNCRVSNKKIQDIINRYFACAPQVDLSQTRFDYDGKYYYHQETGGWTNDGFAITLDAYDGGCNTYYVSFLTFGAGNYWTNDVMWLSLAEAERQYGTTYRGGHAWITATNLADRSTYRMISFSCS